MATNETGHQERNEQRDWTKENRMNIENKTILITGANRGIRRALVAEALRRGAKKVYAGTRSALQVTDERVTPVTLDRSEEHTSELQSQSNLVCRLLLEKKK